MPEHTNADDTYSTSVCSNKHASQTVPQVKAPSVAAQPSTPLSLDSSRTASRTKSPDSQPSAAQLDKRKKRMQTDLDAVPIETAPSAHKYIIRRPRALQATYQGRSVEAGDDGVDMRIIDELTVSHHQSAEKNALSADSSTSEVVEERSSDNVENQRERVDLFIDLLWVGIISNISEHYFAQAFSGTEESGHAMIEFILLFLPAWSIWSELQVFLSSYYMDDLIQRLIIIWILILGLIWGNNAPYLLSNSNAVSWTISVYIIATATLRFTELIYSIWIPWLRRRWLWRVIITLPITGFWIAAIFTRGNTQLGMVFATLVCERLWVILEASPLGERLGGGQGHILKRVNYKHQIKRIENFFIITVGEGVFLLVRGSPLGDGLTSQLGKGVMALMIYYIIHWTYFYGDHTKTRVRPAYRRWFIRILWYFVHIPLFMATVLLSSAMLYLVDYTPEGETNSQPEGGIQKRADGNTCSTSSEASSAARLPRRATSDPACTDHQTLRIAIATACIALAVVFFQLLVLALLVKPLDGPKTLLINNRHLRLLPRMLSVIALATMWLHDFQDPTSVVGLMVLICWIVFTWEWVVGMETGGGLIEPKLLGH